MKTGDKVTFRTATGRTLTGVFKSWTMGGFFVFVANEGPAGTAFRVTQSQVMPQASNGTEDPK